jgi:hypothetical protein
MVARRALFTLALLAGSALTACAPEPDATLLIRGSGHADAPAKTPQDIASPSGTPASLLVGLRALRVSSAADCSGLVVVQDHGATDVVVDFMADPLLFAGSPPDGSYACVALDMSDVLRMKPASSFGACVAGQEYAGDIYRQDEVDWKDASFAQVVGHGTDGAPVEDGVTIFLTRDVAAAESLGISPHQLIELGADLVVPGTSTFVWDAAGSVVSEGGRCAVNPGVPSFR